MHMYSARKTVLQNRAITRILKGEMCFATETSLASARSLSRDSNGLQIEVEKFLGTVRAA
jgi:hypothetical protein